MRSVAARKAPAFCLSLCGLAGYPDLAHGEHIIEVVIPEQCVALLVLLDSKVVYGLRGNTALLPVLIDFILATGVFRLRIPVIRRAMNAAFCKGIGDTCFAEKLFDRFYIGLATLDICVNHIDITTTAKAVEVMCFGIVDERRCVLAMNRAFCLAALGVIVRETEFLSDDICIPVSKCIFRPENQVFINNQSSSLPS